MRYSLFSITVEDLKRINKKDIYNVGEIGCVETMIQISYSNIDSLCVGFGPNKKEIHGIAGSFRQWAGVSQLWACFGKEVDKHPIALGKVCESMIDYARREQELRRVSLTVRSQYNVGNRFAAFMGFDFEGKMSGYFDDGGDANLFARLF